jgi:hypothetical protein
MGNYYTTVTAERTLKATPKEYEALKAALEAPDDDNVCGFEVSYWPCESEVNVFAPDCGDWDELPERFRVLLGSLIAKNGLEYLEFGASFTYDKPRVGSHGGTYFRIRRDGSLWEPTLTW